MSNIDRASPGDEVHLVTDVQNGEGTTVKFQIATAQGDELDQLTATVQGGVARAIWKADAHGRSLPLGIKFFATVADQTVESGALTLDSPGVVATPSWLLLATAGGAAATGGELSSLEAGDGLVGQQAPAARIRYRRLAAGDRVGLLVDVAGATGRPLVGDFDLLFELQQEQSDGAGDFSTVKQFLRSLSAPGGVRQVAAQWTVDGSLPSRRFRFLVSWKRRPGEAQTPDAASGTVTSRPA